MEIYKLSNCINYIDHLGGICYVRWGDTPIKPIAISLFVPLNKVYCFCDVGYHHQNSHIAPNAKAGHFLTLQHTV